MSVNVTGRQFEVTQDIRDFAVPRLEALEAEPVLKTSSVKMVIQKEKNRFSVNLVLSCKYHVISAKTEDFDVFKAIETAVQKADAQIRSLRDKIIEHQAQPLSEAERSAAESAALE